MSLWIHRYRPKSLSELTYNQHLTENLEQLCREEDFPHLLLYGPPGAGKQTRVGCILQELFGPGSRKIKIESRTLDLGGSRKLELNMVSSIFHVEITPSEAGNQDRFVVQELLKEIAQTQQVDQQAKHKFKVVVINEADMLTREAQAALRRTMEIYTKNLRLIMVSNSLSPIMGPIRSRTLLVRVPAPTVPEIARTLGEIADNEGVKMSESDRIAVFTKIATSCDRNMRRAMLILEGMYCQNEHITQKSQLPIPDWEAVLDKEAQDIVKNRSVRMIAEARATNYELLAHCIPPQIVLKSLLFKILSRVSTSVAPQIIECGAQYDHRLRMGSKAIFHIEAFIANVMNILETSRA